MYKFYIINICYFSPYKFIFHYLNIGIIIIKKLIVKLKLRNYMLIFSQKLLFILTTIKQY